MKALLIMLLALTSSVTFASNLEIIISERSSNDVKTLLKDNAKLIISKAKQYKIQLDERSFERMECMSTSSGLGSCTITGDQFMPNSSSIWIITVTSPNAMACDYDTTLIKFEFMASEC